MGALYGHRWAAQYGESAAGVLGRTWETVIAGLTRQQLAAGLNACAAEGAEFPPSAPRFRAMCLDIPTFDRVKREALTPDDRSEFTARRVWGYLDVYNYRNSSVTQAEKLLRSAYELAVEDVMKGVPLPPLALDEPPVVRATFNSGLHASGYSTMDQSPEAKAARRAWFEANVEDPFT